MIRETSAMAYRQIEAEGLLSPRRWAIYQELFKNGPLTANELFRNIFGASSINQANVTTRLNEMRKMGCAKEVGDKVCPITGMQVILWDVTELVPARLQGKLDPTRNELIHSLCLTIEEISANLKSQKNVPEKWTLWMSRALGVVTQCSRHRARARKN